MNKLSKSPLKEIITGQDVKIKKLMDERQELRELAISANLNTTHYSGCWRYHTSCALIKILDESESEKELLNLVSSLTAERDALRAVVEEARYELREYVAAGEYEFKPVTAPEAFLQQELKAIIRDVRAILDRGLKGSDGA